MIDITAPSAPEKSISVIEKLVRNGIDLARITFSSDGNESKPRFDNRGQLIGMGTGDVSTLLETMQELVHTNTLPLPQALTLITSNPATRLGLSKYKGHIRPGAEPI